MTSAVNKHRHMVILSIIFAVCILIEIFVCNANSFRIRNNGKFQMRRYPLDQLEIVNAEVDAADGTITYRGEDDGSVFIHIRNIDTVIGSPHFSC